MASRKLAVTSVPSLLLIGAFLLVMASPGAVSEEGAASDQLSSTVRAPEPPSPKNYDTVRAGSPAVSSLIGDLTSAPEGSAAIPPQAPAPQPHPPPKESDHKLCLILLMIILVCCLLQN